MNEKIDPLRCNIKGPVNKKELKKLMDSLKSISHSMYNPNTEQVLLELHLLWYSNLDEEVPDAQDIANDLEKVLPLIKRTPKELKMVTSDLSYSGILRFVQNEDQSYEIRKTVFGSDQRVRKFKTNDLTEIASYLKKRYGKVKK